MTKAKPAERQSAAQAKAESRHFRRVKLDLPGRLFLPARASEAPCTILDMSPGGMALLSETLPELGSAVVVYLDGFGRFEGHVVRHDRRSFALAFDCTPSKRRRTAEQLVQFLETRLGYERLLEGEDNRTGMVRFTRADGQVVEGTVRDISLTGVWLKTEVKPPLGEFVLIAQIAGRVARHHADGIEIDFVSGAR